MNKRTIIMGVGSAVVLLAAFGYRFFDSGQGHSVNTMEQNTGAVLNEPAVSQSQTVRIPEKGRIAQSIDALAHQIVSSSPNQEEAFTFLVEAKSYRIQELKARRAKERAEEAKSNYDAELWHRKMGQIDAELAKELEKDSIDTQAGSQNMYQGNYQPNIATGQRVANDNANVSKAIQLSDFVLRAIVRDGNGYVARLAYGTKNVPAKQGYTLFGKVDVQSVTENQVVLKKDGDEVTLYAY